MLALACAVTVVVAPGTGGTPAAAAPDPLVADSLAALDDLVSNANCEIVDGADGSTGPGDNELPFRFCDDGLPPGRGGGNAVPVPADYADRAGGDDYTGLRPPASIEEVALEDAEKDLQPESGNRISLDVDISIPAGRAPEAGRPLLLLTHDCCAATKGAWERSQVDDPGRRWLSSNAYWAARGYVVVTYTARGYSDEDGRGSSGTTQLGSRSYEVNDLQYLAGLLADHDRSRRRSGEDEVFSIDPRRVGVIGEGTGGGVAWLALTDPRWESPASGIRMKLRAVVPRSGPTDVLESLVPGGHYLDRKTATGAGTVAPSRAARALSLDPPGVLKKSIAAEMHSEAAPGGGALLPEWFEDGYAALLDGEPYGGDPDVAHFGDTLVKAASAYFQTRFWNSVKDGLRVPVFAAGSWTDPRFGAMEPVRFVNKLKKLAPRYPIHLYLGDTGRFTQDKDKEWGDLCGDAGKLCRLRHFRTSSGKINWKKAPARTRRGINTRINAFLDHHLKGARRRVPHRVDSTTTTCKANATERFPAGRPGIEYRAPRWRGLAPARQIFNPAGGGTVNPNVTDDRGVPGDPIERAASGDACFTTSDLDAPAGVVQVSTGRSKVGFTMMGMPAVLLKIAPATKNYWLAVRMFDRPPSGPMTLVARGVCRAGSGATCDAFELAGGSWRFGRRHRIVLEFTSADSPYLRRSEVGGPVDISGVTLKVPVAPESRRTTR